MSGPKPRWWQLLVVAAAAAAFWFSPPGRFVHDHVWPQVGQLVEIARSGAPREEVAGALIGADYRFAQFLRETTPDDAVLLISDDPVGSLLAPKRGKNREWLTYYLYPRMVLYLHEQNERRYRFATHLIIDGPASTSWMPPSMRSEYAVDQLSCIPFDMNRYIGELEVRGLESFMPPRQPATDTYSRRLQ